MFNNEYDDVKKYCCLYSSDYHLEMILLPYIKRNLDESNFLILTQTNLFPTISLLLEKTNFTTEDKNKILDLNWYTKNENIISNYDLENSTIIINGSQSYIDGVITKFQNKKITNSTLIYCYDVSEKKLTDDLQKEHFDAFLNTASI